MNLDWLHIEQALYHLAVYYMFVYTYFYAYVHLRFKHVILGTHLSKLFTIWLYIIYLSLIFMCMSTLGSSKLSWEYTSSAIWKFCSFCKLLVVTKREEGVVALNLAIGPLKTCSGYSFWLTARVLLYVPSHRQDSTYHGICYTICGALTGTRNSSMGRPWVNALPRSYILLHERGTSMNTIKTYHNGSLQQIEPYTNSKYHSNPNPIFISDPKPIYGQRDIQTDIDWYTNRQTDRHRHIDRQRVIYIGR